MRSTLLGLACLLSLVGCTQPRQYVWSADYIREGQDKAPVVLKAGDRLQVLVRGQESLSAQAEIRPDGEIVLPVVGSVAAANMTPSALASAVAARISGIVASPVVTVVVEQHRTLVTVLGEVRAPGQYEMTSREGVLGAVARAGGLTAFAETDRVFVLRREPKLARIRFDYDDLTSADPVQLGFVLRDGDIIVVQ